MTLDELFGDVRATLQSPTQDNWTALTAALTAAWPLDAALVTEEWLPYVMGHLDDWPDELRIVPHAWLREERDAVLSAETSWRPLIDLGRPLRASDWPKGRVVEVALDAGPVLEPKQTMQPFPGKHATGFARHATKDFAVSIHSGNEWTLLDLEIGLTMAKHHIVPPEEDARVHKPVFARDGIHVMLHQWWPNEVNRIYGCELMSGEVSWELEPGYIEAYAMTPEDDTLVYNHNGGVEIVDWRTGDVLWECETNGSLNSALHVDGAKVLVDSGLTVEFVELYTGRSITSLPSRLSEPFHIHLSPGGRHAAVCRFDRTTRVYELLTGDLVFEVPALPGWAVYDVVFSPNGRDVALAWLDERTEEQMIYQVLDGHTGAALYQVNLSSETMDHSLGVFTRDASMFWCTVGDEIRGFAV